jgi:hypothetical protein
MLFRSVFASKLAIFGKIVGQHLCISSENLNFLKPNKNSYMEPLWIIDPQYRDHDQEVRSFIQFLPKTDDFW